MFPDEVAEHFVAFEIIDIAILAALKKSENEAGYSVLLTRLYAFSMNPYRSESFSFSPT